MRCGSPSTHSPGAGCSLVSRATPECGWEEARSHQWQGHGGAAFSTHAHARTRTHTHTRLRAARVTRSGEPAAGSSV